MLSFSAASNHDRSPSRPRVASWVDVLRIVYHFFLSGRKRPSFRVAGAASHIPTQRAGAAAVVMNGKLIILGGESAQPIAHDSVEELDPATGRWTALQPLSMGRHATQAILHNGRIYLASGSRTRGATEVDTQEVYSPAPR